MSRTASPKAPPPGRSMVLEDVDWNMYNRLLLAFAERPRVRLTYDRGRLEIMAPLLAHDDDSDFVGDMVKILAEEFGLPLKRGGSVTIRRRQIERGIEPDRCFWIANAERMAGVRKLDLRRHPPPDLAIEIDVTHSSMDRIDIYAKLGVPELWRLDGNALIFYVLDDAGTYQASPQSKTFPTIAPGDLLPFIKEARETGDEIPLMKRFRKWAHQRGNAR